MPSRIFHRLRKRFSRQASRAERRAQGPDLLKQKLAERQITDLVARQPDGAPSRRASAELGLERLVPVTHGPRLLNHSDLPVELRMGVDADVLDLIHPDVAHDQQVIPYRFNSENAAVHLAVPAPPTPDRDAALVTLLRAKLGARIQAAYHVLDDQRAFRTLLAAYYPQRGSDVVVEAAGSAERFLARMAPAPTLPAEIAAGDPATVRFVHALVDYAHKHGAKDLTIAPTVAGIETKIRVDRGHEPIVPLAGNARAGACEYLMRVLKQMCQPAVSALDSGTQKGNFTYTSEQGHAFDVRVNFSPTIFGQMAVLRLHQKDVAALVFDRVVDDRFTREHLSRGIESRRGVIIISSPPSNGKSTLIHSMLRPGVIPHGSQVFSIENPPEIVNPFVYQQRVTPEHSADHLFAHCLQSAATHVFVGEITTTETASTVFDAATSGVQIFTTIHARSASRTIERLRALKLDKSAIATGLAAVCSTWLLPTLCDKCDLPLALDEGDLLRHQFFTDELGSLDMRTGEGCQLCAMTGERGMVQIFETMPLTPDVRARIEGPKKGIVHDLQLAAARAGMTPLRRVVLDLAGAGRIHPRHIAEFPELTPEELEIIHDHRNRRLLNP